MAVSSFQAPSLPKCMEITKVVSLLLATSDAQCPCTQYPSIKFHHFWDQVLNGTILQVVKVHTNDTWADIFMKPFPKPKLNIFISYSWDAKSLVDALQGNRFSPTSICGFLWLVTQPKSCTSCIQPQLLTLDISSQGSLPSYPCMWFSFLSDVDSQVTHLNVFSCSPHSQGIIVLPTSSS